MTTMTVKELETDVPKALRRVTAGHDPVLLKRGGRTVAVIVPAEQYFDTKESDIPDSFWQGLKESQAGLGVDMETALHEAPPRV